MADVPRMTKEELKEKLNHPDMTIIDVRKDSDYESSPFKISRAIRENPGEVQYWMEKYRRDEQLLLYCA